MQLMQPVKGAERHEVMKASGENAGQSNVGSPSLLFQTSISGIEAGARARVYDNHTPYGKSLLGSDAIGPPSFSIIETSKELRIIHSVILSHAGHSADAEHSRA